MDIIGIGSFWKNSGFESDQEGRISIETSIELIKVEDILTRDEVVI